MSTLPAAPAGEGLVLDLRCPQCGAPSPIDADAVSFTCGHCGSFLVVAHSGRQEMYLAQETIRSAEDVRQTVILYRVQSHRAELVARFGTRHEDGRVEPPSEDFILRKMRELEERLLAQMQVVHARRFYVPYWHLSGSILQAVLGRRRDGPKQMVVRCLSVEHSVPAYDEGALNARDRGLRLSGARVRPLGRKDVAEIDAFVPWRQIEPRAYHEINKWRTRDLEPGIEPISKHGAYVFGRRLLVYRAYWVARVTDDRGPSWVLVDGGFGTIAGYPDHVEAAAMVRQCTADPAPDEGVHALVRASRCPDCGAEQTLRTTARATVCHNCHLLLVPEEVGFRVGSYDHAAFDAVDRDACYLPFWAFSFRLTPVGGRPATTLDAWAKLLFTAGLPPGIALSGDRIFVPAFRLLGTDPGDDAFQDLSRALHEAGPRIVEGKVLLGGRPEFEDATVPEEHAREAATFVLYGLHGRVSAARLNPMVLRRCVEQAKLELQPGRLVYVPFERREDGYALGGGAVVLPRLLVEGGPELEALRVSVHRRAAQQAS